VIVDGISAVVGGFMIVFGICIVADIISGISVRLLGLWEQFAVKDWVTDISAAFRKA